MIPEIKIETNYEKFKFASFNRQVASVTIKKLKDEFKTENNFMYFPIIVDQDMVIIDGQHRFVACKELGEPIYYIVKNKPCTPRDIRSVNKAGKRHTITDVFEMEYKIGNKQAVTAKNIWNDLERKIDLGCLLALCLQVSSGGQVRDRLENGLFSVKNENWTRDIGRSMIKLTNNTKVNTVIYNSLFYVASKGNIKVDVLLNTLHVKGLTLSHVMSKTNVINKIVDTYNYNRRKDRITIS